MTQTIPSPTAQISTHVGQLGTKAFDGWAGFRIGQRYELEVSREFNEVRIVLAHGPVGAEPLVVTSAQFEKWWVG